MNYVFRLTKGQDLKEEINKFVKENNIEAGIVKSGVGCVDKARFRLATGESFFEKEAPYEIISLMGTVSKNGCHIHIGLADIEGTAIGGHLTEGCIINTTCEVCIEELTDKVFDRKMDESTGYKELVITEK